MKKFIKILSLTFVFSFSASANEKVEILNVSYDPTRELYKEYNEYFSNYWKEKTGQEVKIKLSNGGSGKQARSVIDGLKADVVTLALGFDIDVIAQRAGLLNADWQSEFENNSSPYTSTIVFLVRNGNPKAIKDWSDLANEGVKVITPNPKTSGGARWNYLAAWAYANKKFNGDETHIKDFLKKLFANVAVYDTGARGSTVTFAQRGIGDVLISWENEAFLAKKEFGDKFEIIVPSISVLAEPPVAIIDKVAEKKQTQQVAKEYLQQLFSKEGQEIIAKNFYRPFDAEIAKKYADKFPALELVTIRDFGGWAEAQKKHFDDGGLFDQITKK